MPGILQGNSVNDLITLIIMIVCSCHYIKNPYLTAKLVEVMFVLNPAVQRQTTKLNEYMLNHPLATEHLVPALMKFYTG